MPLLTVDRLEPEHELVCLVFTGRAQAAMATLFEAPRAYGWREDGTFVVQWGDGEEIVVPALPVA